MKTLILIALLLTIVCIPMLSQSHLQWSATYDNPGGFNDRANSIAVDNLGNVIAVGSADLEQFNSDCLVIKYNSLGEEQWHNIFRGDGGEIDFLNSVAVDDSGNIFVTGNIGNASTLWDIVTAKYDPNGVEKWYKVYNGSSNSWDGGTALLLDSLGNCYVGGYADNTGSAEDFILLKYDPSGNELWKQKFGGDALEHDVILAMTMDDSLNIYVTGRSVGIGTMDDFTTIKYNTDGLFIWSALYNDSTINYGETPRSVSVDKSGNVFVSGWTADGISMGDFLTIKYNSNGDREWLKRFHGNSIGGEGAYSVRIDDLGNSYIGGAVSSAPGNDDYTIIKYNPDGNEIWNATYDGSAQGSDWIQDLEIGSDGNIYVTGWSEGLNTGTDIVTIAYDTSGNQKWIERLDGKASSEDRAFSLVVDNNGNIFSAGYAIMDSSFSSDLVIIKYSPRPTSVNNSGSEIPTSFELSQNYPNPTNPSTKIQYAITSTQFVSLKVYDILGKEVTSLVNEEKSVGSYEVDFNASSLSSGIYFYKLEAGKFTQTRKMLLLK